MLRRLEQRGTLQRPIAQLFHALRTSGNRAMHELKGDTMEALHQLKMARQIAIWFHRTFGRAPAFNPGPFVPPVDPHEENRAVARELERLREDLAHAKVAIVQQKTIAEQEARERLSAQERAQKESEERTVWEALAAEAEQKLAAELQKLQVAAVAQPAKEIQKLVALAGDAAEHIELDEAATRRLIDEQLRAAGWQVDTDAISYQEGVRPQKGKNLAIAEWPADDPAHDGAHGRADYVLFIGLKAVGIVEAKRKKKDVPSVLQQAKRYARGLQLKPENLVEGGPWSKSVVPFLFATNGRPYLKQLEAQSGVWFLDARKTTNHPRALDGWHSPEGLEGLLRTDVDRAAEELRHEPVEILGLHAFQRDAIRAVEEGLASGRRSMLLAMATGTGKTRTAIGLCYRLIKSKAVRRILFLVDRTSLGVQAQDAFKDARIETSKTFADIYELKELKDIRIVTALAEDGITWKKGEAMEVYDPATQTVDTVTLPDDVSIEVEGFNKRVVTESFNEVVCAVLADHLDPTNDAAGKTLIFCATDQHADLVVTLLKKALEKSGPVDDDAVMKITGASDQPLQLIRRLKNEKLPNIAVTVDLLTTGVDVPRICNIVFLRRVRSRILYDQMLGRATRKCDAIGKEVFRIFDAVDLYPQMQKVSDMKPVVTNPSITFGQLADELARVTEAHHRQVVVDQLIAKLQAKARRLKGESLDRFQTMAGMSPTGAEKEIPNGYRWSDVESRDGEELMTFYRGLLLHLGTKTRSRRVREIYDSASTSLKHPKNLRKLVQNIDDLDWHDAKEEGLGDMYEGLLEKNAGEKKSGAGQYFTPRPLIDSMVHLVKPKPGERVQDPAAGTGGFLIAADRYIKSQLEDGLYALPTAQQEFQKKEAFLGVELVQDTHRLALMNLMLHDIEGSIEQGDTLSPLGSNLPKADVILTNPPFGTKQGVGLPTRDDFTYKTSNKQLAFVQHVYRGLVPNGRAAVVVPDNVLFED